MVDRYLLVGFARFGWASNQEEGSFAEQRANAVEVQRENTAGDSTTWTSTNTSNVYGEIVANQRNTAIYQDIATTPGAVYI